MRLRHLLLMLALGVLLPASECVPVGDDDDASDDDDLTDDDDVADDDDSVEPVLTTISGEVIAVDRDTGLELDDESYADRAGGLIVYALPDGADLSEIFGKATMDGPGDFEILLEGVEGPFDLVVVADEDSNRFIENSDVSRAYAFNPLVAGGDLEDVTLVIDLAPRGGGSGCGDRDTISGTVVLDGVPDGSIGISTNNASLTWGPFTSTTLPAAGPYAITECSSRDSIALLGYLDEDANGYFEPSDPIGGAAANPITLGLGDVSGITITIPDDTIDPPAPPAYVALTGTVAYPAFSTGDILVFASHVTTDGYLFSTVTLAAPGAFALLAPANTSSVLVWAVLDEDGDGEADASVDPSDSALVNSGTGVSGIDLELGPAALGTLSGAIDYAGGAGPGDVLHIAVFSTEVYDPSDGPPVAFLEITGPTLPEAYTISGVPSGTYWVGSYLDIGGDDPLSAGPEDPDGQIGPVLLAPGATADGLDITVVDP